MLDLTVYERKRLESLKRNELIDCLKEIELLLLKEFQQLKERYPSENGIDMAKEILTKLEPLGYEFFSWGYDGEAEEEWGGNYMNKDAMSPLIVRVTREWDIYVSWYVCDELRIDTK